MRTAAHGSRLRGAKDLHDEALRSLTVELCIEHALPRAEVEAAFRDRDDDLVVDEERLQVGISVVFAGSMMLVFITERSDAFEPLPNVLVDAGLGVVHEEADRDLPRARAHGSL